MKMEGDKDNRVNVAISIKDWRPCTGIRQQRLQNNGTKNTSRIVKSYCYRKFVFASLNRRKPGS